MNLKHLWQVSTSRRLRYSPKVYQSAISNLLINVMGTSGHISTPNTAKTTDPTMQLLLRQTLFSSLVLFQQSMPSEFSPILTGGFVSHYCICQFASSLTSAAAEMRAPICVCVSHKPKTFLFITNRHYFSTFLY